MNLTTEIKFILQGGSPTQIREEDGRFTQQFLTFLAKNQIPY